MKVVRPSAEILSNSPDIERVIELAGRVCWKSEEKIMAGSAEKFIAMLMSKKHASVLEHGSITVRFICDRGVSHELVRHRLASFSQESTRYCNYSQDKYGSELAFIKPLFFSEGTTLYNLWYAMCHEAETVYLQMLNEGATAQEARSILPNSLKTEVVMTCNPRQWMHVFDLRCDRAAHPQMREVMIPLREEFQNNWPAIFANSAETLLTNA